MNLRAIYGWTEFQQGRHWYRLGISKGNRSCRRNSGNSKRNETPPTAFRRLNNNFKTSSKLPGKKYV